MWTQPSARLAPSAPTAATAGASITSISAKVGRDPRSDPHQEASRSTLANQCPRRHDHEASRNLWHISGGRKCLRNIGRRPRTPSETSEAAATIVSSLFKTENDRNWRIPCSATSYIYDLSLYNKYTLNPPLSLSLITTLLFISTSSDITRALGSIGKASEPSEIPRSLSGVLV